MKSAVRILLPFFAFFLHIPLFGSELGGGSHMTEKMMVLIFQIAILVTAAKIFGMIFVKLKLPSVLGELFAGIILGPYLLGSIAFPGFLHGMFPLSGTELMPVSAELYGMATFASIILLFLTGLETDIEMFLRYSFAGSLVGIGGVIASFMIGAFTGMYFLGLPFMSPAILFLGVMSTATSVGITARILSEKRSLDSPEGVTTLAGAVIDDILGIILLAIAIGIAGAMLDNSGESIQWGKISLIAVKAIAVWVLFTATGLLFAHKIANFLKKFKDKSLISIFSLGLALIVSGIFEQQGLAMIVGAYVTGLSLSKTDISYVIQETLHPLQMFFIPLFFAVSGMMVDLRVFLSKEILVFGLVYSTGAIIAKFAGCGIPALFMGFNKLGASRIGLGMIPRGEVALIIAGIGLSNGILDQRIFGVSIMMTLITTLVSPPVLSAVYSIKRRGTRKKPVTGDTVETEYSFNSELITIALVRQIRDYFSKEGFYIYMMEIDHKIYQIRKDKIFIKMLHHKDKIVFITSEEDVALVKTITYEAFVKLNYLFEKVHNDAFPEIIRKELSVGHVCRDCFNLSSILDPECIKMNLVSDTKEGIVRELVSLLYEKGLVKNKEGVISEVLDREKVISTGMEKGFAIPHARTEDVDHVQLAVGIKREGIDFDSIDKEPVKVIVLLISSEKTNDPHIQILASLSTMFLTSGGMDNLLNARTREEIWKAFNNFSNRKKFESGNVPSLGSYFRKI
jgi:Kef-type K+ transport system membrane component KefB/mannitol/fructose-specific phosphotransferase system IIA component (Ntr-type)